MNFKHPNQNHHLAINRGIGVAIDGYLKYRHAIMSTANTALKASEQGSSKRSRKRDRIIELASVQMNRRGAASVDLAEIGTELGMARNSMYYYFKDKHALTEACYEAAVCYSEGSLRLAFDHNGTVTEKLLVFITNSLNEQSHSIAVMSDLDLTEEGRSSDLGERQSAVLNSLHELIEAGVENGEFRRLPSRLAAHVLISMLEWKRLWCAFMGQDVSALADGARDMERWIRQGVLVDRTYRLQNPPKFNEVFTTPVNVMDPKSINEQKRLFLLGAASALFNRRGIDATTIDDIAAALDSTKGFVYNHAEDKQQLVRMCYDRAFDMYERIWEVSEKCGPGSADSILTSMHLHCQAQLSNTPPLTVQSQLGDLPLSYRARSSAIRGKYAAGVRQAVKKKVAHPKSQKFVDISPGAFFWLGKSGLTPPQSENLPDQIADLTAHGFCA